MERLYVDTNIYLDYWGNRSDGLRPLGEFAFQLIKRAIGCEFVFIVSDFVLLELRKQLSEKDIEAVLEALKEKKKLIFVKHKKSDRPLAKRLAKERGVPWQDVLHVLIAKREAAKYMVTRDNHFEKLSDLVEPIFPENI